MTKRANDHRYEDDDDCILNSMDKYSKSTIMLDVESSGVYKRSKEESSPTISLTRDVTIDGKKKEEEEEEEEAAAATATKQEKERVSSFRNRIENEKNKLNKRLIEKDDYIEELEEERYNMKRRLNALRSKRTEYLRKMEVKESKINDILYRLSNIPDEIINTHNERTSIVESLDRLDGREGSFKSKKPIQ